MNTVAILLTAGLSTRFDSTKSKLLGLLNKKAVFSYALDELAKSKEIDQLIVVVSKETKPEIEKYSLNKGINAKFVLGGKTRQESVKNALNTLSLDNDDLVLIHDGARPLIDQNIIKEIKNAAKKYGAATTYIPLNDTVAMINKNNTAVSYPNREEIVRIQTPQCFKFNLIKKSHDLKLKNASDDSSMVFMLNGKVKLVKGYKKLHKITTLEDIDYLEGLLK